jgi:PST family polysaccharide transporter
MNLIRATLLTGFSSGVRIISGFAANKLIAIYAGPGGLAQVGHFVNFTSIATALAGGGVALGVTKYLAEYRAKKLLVTRLLDAALGVTLLCSLLVACSVLLWRHELSLWLFGSSRHGDVLAATAVALLPAALNGLLLAVLAGQKAVGKIVQLNILASLASLGLFAGLTVSSGLPGALLAVALSQAAAFLISLAWGGWSALRGVQPRMDGENLAKLARFSAMAIVSAITLPLSLMIVRNHLGQTLSWDEAGYWQAVWKISDAYLLLVTAAFGSYYLPRLSELNEAAALKREILHGYKVLLPIAAVSALLIYLLREPITRILFSDAFLPMTELFAFQLVGDVFKVGSWMLAHLMLAKAMTKTFIASELLFGVCFVVTSLILSARFGMVGVSYAFALSYLLYWLGMAWVFRQAMRNLA